jgi:hypothetical protein
LPPYLEDINDCDLMEILMLRVDGSFRVLERVNDNAYKVDLPGEYNVSTIFNLKDL